MFLAGVDISKTAYFIKAQSVWQRVTKLIPYDYVTRFDGILQFKFFQQVKKYMWSPFPGAKYWPLTVIPASEYSDIWARASLLVTFHRA